MKTANRPSSPKEIRLSLKPPSLSSNLDSPFASRLSDSDFRFSFDPEIWNAAHCLE